MNHYQVLALPGPPRSHSFSAADIKRAYHITLLKYHPDKGSVVTTSGPSVDSIKLAYEVLTNPVARREHDRDLATRQNGNVKPSDAESSDEFRTGEELVDLDDLEYDKKQGIWCSRCRCGEERGFVVTEGQLVQAEEKGGREVLIGCIGCSLWMRVLFGVVDDRETVSRREGG